MGWARFDDGYMDHPKVMAAGPWAELLDRRAIEHCAKGGMGMGCVAFGYGWRNVEVAPRRGNVRGRGRYLTGGTDVFHRAMPVNDPANRG